ncbi:MAG TPA: ABC transporter permease [Casimicrobiaceae bacterium]|nr:ABC transporter permease [Casimicrobiaceae bacterium]
MQANRGAYRGARRAAENSAASVNWQLTTDFWSGIAGARDALEAICLSLGAIVVALLLFGGFVALDGKNPLAVYSVLYLGAFGTRFSIEGTLTQASPIILTALCTALPARVGLLVIGGEGALVLGGLCAVLTGVAVAKAPAFIGTLVALLGGTCAGALWIASVGALKRLRGVNETITSLLLNYIAIALFNHLISGPIRDFSITLKAQSWSVPQAFGIGAIPGWSVHWGLVIGVCACIALFVVIRHTTLGFSMDVLGGNRRAAQVAGLPIGRLVILACAIGGGAAGLAGAIEVLAVHGAASESLIVGFGYTGILVAFLARQNPLAIVPVALLVGGISASGGLLQRRFDMPDATTQVLQGLIFLCVLASNALAGRFRWFAR